MASQDDVTMIRAAIAEAGGSSRCHGAIARRLGVVVAAHDTSEEERDPTAHAVVNVLRGLAAAAGQWRLDGAVVWSTHEPCAMCAGALVVARVSRLVFGAAQPGSGAAGSRYNVLADPRLLHEVESEQGVLALECVALVHER